MTPLSLAAYGGYLPVCEFLIGIGANKDFADKVGIRTNIWKS